MTPSIANSMLKAAIPVIAKRNFASSYVLLAKTADPIQQLFIDKIREFGVKINDKNFVKEYPELQKSLDDELSRVTRQFGGDKPEDLMKFPELRPAAETPIDPQPGLF